MRIKSGRSTTPHPCTYVGAKGGPRQSASTMMILATGRCEYITVRPQNVLLVINDTRHLKTCFSTLDLSPSVDHSVCPNQVPLSFLLDQDPKPKHNREWQDKLHVSLHERPVCLLFQDNHHPPSIVFSSQAARVLQFLVLLHHQGFRSIFFFLVWTSLWTRHC